LDLGGDIIVGIIGITLVGIIGITDHIFPIEE
jgi:hypothetical protein